MKFSLVSFFVLVCLWVNAQNPNKHIRQGNKAFADSAYVAAEENYRQALAADQNAFNAAFNLADAIYKQENYGEAATLFQGLTEKAKSSSNKAMAYHNLGNSYLKEQKLNESIEAYKSALRNNPTDAESKYNLAYAQRMKQQQEENQEEEQEENQEEQQEQQQEENKEEEQEQQESQQDSKQEEQQQEEQKPQETQNPDQISKEEAEKMLDALQQQEKELQEDLQKKKAKGVKLKIEKDW